MGEIIQTLFLQGDGTLSEKGRKTSMTPASEGKASAESEYQRRAAKIVSAIRQNTPLETIEKYIVIAIEKSVKQAQYRRDRSWEKTSASLNTKLIEALEAEHEANPGYNILHVNPCDICKLIKQSRSGEGR